MAIVKELDHAGFAEWLSTRPAVIQEMAARCPPDRLYRINSGHRVTLYSYSENGTVTVDVTGQFNRITFGRRVFGVPIGELAECDPPSPDEDVGDTSQEAGYSQEDVRNILIPKMREQMGLPDINAAAGPGQEASR